MTIYFGLIFAFVLFHALFLNIRSRHKRGLECFLDGLCLFLVMALRKYTIGTDTIQYKILFEQIAQAGGNINGFGMEIGFLYYNVLVLKLFGNNFQWLLASSSLIICGSLAYFICKNSENILESFVLIVLSNLLLGYQSMMRAALAFSIVLLGYGFLRKKKYIIFLIFVLFASTFHISALFSIVLIFIKKIDWKNESAFFMLLFLTICAIASPVLFSLLLKVFPQYSVYSTAVLGTSNFGGALFQFGFLALILILSQYLISTAQKRNVDIGFDTNLLLGIFYLFTVINGMAMGVKIFSRVASVIAPYELLFVPAVLSISERLYPRYKYRFTTIYFGLYLLFFLVINIARPEWFSGVPYNFYWE
jgi:hypothetical protein